MEGIVGRRPVMRVVGQDKMNVALTRCVAMFAFGGLPVLVAAQEPAVTGPPGWRLVEVKSEDASRMLQLRWRIGPKDSATREDLFWFAEAMNEKDAFNLTPTLSTSVTEGDGQEGWSRTEIGVKEVTPTQIVIRVLRTKGLWRAADKKPVTQLDEILKVPVRNVEPTTQGKIEFTARWWGLAQPSRPAEPRSGL